MGLTSSTDTEETTVSTETTTKPSPWGTHHGLIADALEHLYVTAPARRREVEEAFRSVGEWHNHDQEDEHCDPGCPAWQHHGGGYCGACGTVHETVQPGPVPAVEL